MPSKKKALAAFSQVGRLVAKLKTVTDPGEAFQIANALDNFEGLMKKSGLYEIGKIRPANEGRFRARWKLGQITSKMERSQGARSDRNSTLSQTGTKLRATLKEKGINKNRVNEAEHIACLKEPDLERAFEETRKLDILNTTKSMLDFARPFMKMEVRTKKHRSIIKTVDMFATGGFGPFPIIYSDPPWSFATFTPAGGGRSPEQHYPVLSDNEIIDFRINGLTMSEIAHKDAALFLWCTSSNLPLALRVMEGWGFEFKSSAVWVKDQQGMGLIFRNRHEILLYGSRGNMPGPLYIPGSVFELPRGKHSEKPPQIRNAIEKMYPDYDDTSRLEMFARGHVPGWTTYGFESSKSAA